MFCYQCEETAKGKGCTVAGVCGKNQDTAVLQDLLIFQLKGIGLLAEEARKSGIDTREVDTFVVDALFATLTNVNFDSQRIADFIYEAQKVKENLLQKGVKAAIDNPAVQWKPEGGIALIAKGQEVGVQSEVFGPETEDTLALKELITYGLKGIAAYAHHAQVLGYTDDDIYRFIVETLAALTRRKEVQELVDLALKVGIQPQNHGASGQSPQRNLWKP